MNTHKTKALSPKGKELVAKRLAKEKSGWTQNYKGFLVIPPVKYLPSLDKPFEKVTNS